MQAASGSRLSVQELKLIPIKRYLAKSFAGPERFRDDSICEAPDVDRDLQTEPASCVMVPET
jgi:hypothetical protein